jgi:cytochrome P450
MDATIDAKDVNLLDPATMKCPWPSYAALRDQAPVHPTPFGFILVSRYDDVLAIVRDTERFSSSANGPGGMAGDVDPELAAIMAEGETPVKTLLTNDPPSHTQYRNLVNKAFTPKRVAQIEGEIRSIADDLIDRFAPPGSGAGSVELVHQFAVGLPLTVIADALGVSRDDMVDFKRWSDDSVAPLSGLLTHEDRLRCARSRVEMQRYMKARAAERRSEPRDDMLSDLVTSEVDGHRLNDAELVNIIEQLLVAGNETTTKLIAATMLELVRHPAQMAKLRTQPELIGNAVEEGLRLESPVQLLFRLALVDVELHGVTIPAGSTVAVMYGCANNDDRKYPEPRAFDVERTNARTHLAFGQGPHFCVGAALARAEARIGIERLLARLDDIALDPAQPPEHELGLALRGLAHLHLTFTATAPVPA